MSVITVGDNENKWKKKKKKEKKQIGRQIGRMGWRKL